MKLVLAMEMNGMLSVSHTIRNSKYYIVFYSIKYTMPYIQLLRMQFGMTPGQYKKMIIGEII